MVSTKPRSQHHGDSLTVIRQEKEEQKTCGMISASTCVVLKTKVDSFIQFIAQYILLIGKLITSIVCFLIMSEA